MFKFNSFSNTESDLMPGAERASKSKDAPAVPQSPASPEAPVPSVDPEHEGGAEDGIELLPEAADADKRDAQKNKAREAVEILAKTLATEITTMYVNTLADYRQCILRAEGGDAPKARRNHCRKKLVVPVREFQLYGQYVHNHIMTAPLYNRVIELLASKEGKYDIQTKIFDKRVPPPGKGAETVFAVQMTLRESAYPEDEMLKDIEEQKKI